MPRGHPLVRRRPSTGPVYPEGWYRPPYEANAIIERDVEGWVDIVRGYSAPANVIGDPASFRTFGVDDPATCHLRIKHFQPCDPEDPYVDLEEWILELSIELAPNMARVVDIGPSPWIQLGFYEGERFSSLAPTWLRNTIEDSFTGWHSRARVLEIVEAVLQNNPQVPNYGDIRDWARSASNSFHAHLRRRNWRVRQSVACVEAMDIQTVLMDIDLESTGNGDIEGELSLEASFESLRL